jgi:hypothetical protein
MLLVKRILAAAISAGLGLIFIYSGYAKLLPVIETFEMSFVETGIANWYVAPILARALIGLEFFLGLLLVLNYGLRRFTLPLTLALLAFFTVYLLIQIYTSGNEGNCGCFGEHIMMTPLQAILKNIGMTGGCIVLYFLPSGWQAPKHLLVVSLLAMPPLGLPFILNPVDYSYTSNNLDEKVGYPLELDLLYQPEDSTKVEVPKVELRKGRHVVAFLSLTCRHCRIAAKKFRLISESNPDIPIYFVLNGDREKYDEFISETGAGNIPSSFCLGKTFVQLSSTRLPRIYYLDDGIVKRKVDYYELSQYAIEDWLETGIP